ncbi:transcriptional regulator [Gallibacterium genomosp. 3]|uniref:Transcriptional regulator n=1 Tax=Gallibacterium genomosp. 3 TaxID=505345 RepID=A0A1A7PT82_9PAST|nr:AraC family transcriptional regulator [Gallibacterium genomosp. 3]OBX05264.1 transcriptional regulator [Gallibacterium genomosp. 3]
MDSIDRFLELLDIKTSIDVFCSFKAPYLIEHQQAEKGTAYFHLLLEGSCDMHSAQQTYHLQAGDFCLWTQGGKHHIGHQASQEPLQLEQQNGILYRHNCTTDPTLQMLCGHYRATNHAAAGLLKLLPEPLIVSLKDIPQLQALSSLIHQEALARHLGSATAIKAMCELLLLFALRHLTELPQQQNLIGLFSDPALSKVMTTILEDLSISYTTEELANIAYLSRATFARKFHQATGMGIQTLIRILRMSLAAKLLIQSHLSITQIMEKVGYQSETAFHDAFKAQFGITPARYRKRLQINA